MLTGSRGRIYLYISWGKKEALLWGWGGLPLKITGFALQIFSKLSGTETGSPEPTIGEEAGPTKAECGKDDRLPPSKILDILLLESGLVIISSKKSYSASSYTHICYFMAPSHSS